MSIEDTDSIDFVATEPNGDVLLVMVEGREWSESDQILFQLQEKINTYASFVLDGELVEKYPQLEGRPVCIELRCVDLPDLKAGQLLDIASQ